MQIARPRRRGCRASGPDRLTVLLLTIAAFLIVLALLARQLQASEPPITAHAVVVLRKVYETRYVETRAAAGGAAGTPVTQAVSNSASAPVPAAPTTRSS